MASAMNAPSLPKNAHCLTTVLKALFHSLRISRVAVETKAFLSLCSSLLPGQTCLLESQAQTYRTFSPPCRRAHLLASTPITRKVVFIAGEKDRDGPTGHRLSYWPLPSFFKTDQGRGLVSWWQLWGQQPEAAL